MDITIQNNGRSVAPIFEADGFFRLEQWVDDVKVLSAVLASGQIDGLYLATGVNTFKVFAVPTIENKDVNLKIKFREKVL